MIICNQKAQRLNPLSVLNAKTKTLSGLYTYAGTAKQRLGKAVKTRAQFNRDSEQAVTATIQTWFHIAPAKVRFWRNRVFQPFALNCDAASRSNPFP